MVKEKSYVFDVTVRRTEDGEKVAYAPGKPVMMDPDDAAEIIARHGGRLAKAAEVSEPVVQKPKGKALTDAIVAAIPDLNKEEDFTQTGVPSVPALEKALEFDITAAERDAAFKAYQEANPDLFKDGK